MKYAFYVDLNLFLLFLKNILLVCKIDGLINN
jgi:hypothetical protein